MPLFNAVLRGLDDTEAHVDEVVFSDSWSDGMSEQCSKDVKQLT